MPTFDFNYLFSSTQFAILIFFVVIAFNCIFWIVDSLRGRPPFPQYAPPPLPIVLLGLGLGFVPALPISFVSHFVLNLLNTFHFLIRVPLKIAIFVATSILVFLTMDLVVVGIDRLVRGRRLEGH